MTKLPEKQQQILDFIRSQHVRSGIYPSVREIAAYMGFKSTNTVDYHLKKMEEAGALERGQRRARSYGVQDKGAKFQRRHVSSNREGVPLLGRVAAGVPILAEQHIDDMINFQNFFHCDDSTFALKVQGDSMIEAGIVDGDVVIVRHQAQVENGEIGVALINGEATVKRIFDEKVSWRLEPENASMKAFVVKKNESDFSIAGKVVGVIRKM